MLCAITGIAGKPDGTVYASATFIIYRAPMSVVAQDGRVVAPIVASVVSGADGSVALSLLSGNYVGVETASKVTFPFTVPETATADWADCVELAPSVITPTFPASQLTGTLAAAQEPAHTGDVTNIAGSLTLTIAADAVTNAKLANMATARIKGRSTAGTGDPEDLTAAQVVTMLGAATLTGVETLTNKTISSLLMTGAPRASGLTAAGLGQFLTDLRLGPVFASRAEATSGVTGFTGSANIISVKHNGRLLNYLFDATAGGILTTGDGRTWGPALMVSIDHAGAVSYTTQAAAEAGADSAAAAQAVVDWLTVNNRSAEIDVGFNAYRFASKVTVAKASIGFVGQGKYETSLVITHSAGDEGIRFTRDNPILRNISLTSGVTRAAVSFASSGTMCGVRLEPEDAPDTTVMRLRSCDFEDFAIYNQPSHGLVGVGAVTGNFRTGTFSGNKGHNVHIALDVYPRVNATEVPGLCAFFFGESVNAGGHAFCTEPLTPTTSPVVRFNLFNVEIGNNAQDAAVRLWPSEIYLSGSQIDVQNCVFKPAASNTTIEGFYVRGIGIRIVNNRFIQCTRAGTVSSAALLQTQNVLVDYTKIIDCPANPDPLVKLRIEAGALEPANVQVRNFWGSDVVRATATDGTYTPSPQTVPNLLRNMGTPITFEKLSDQTISDSITLTDCSDLEIYVSANEAVHFRVAVNYVTSATADIRLRMVGPTGSTCDFNSPSGLKVGTGDTATISIVTDQAGNIVFGGSPTGTRTLEISGRFRNGSTAGRLRLQFAQLVAEVSDCTIKAGSIITFYEIVN